MNITKELLDLIKNNYQQFDKHGYLNDENSSFGRKFLENNIDIINEVFISMGYDGEHLICYGKHYNNYGSVYWIVDSRVMSYEQSIDYTDHYVEKMVGKLNE